MGLMDVRQRFFAKFPAAERLDQALRSSSNSRPMFFVASIDESHDHDLKGSGLALLRLGTEFERRFGINGEIAAYFVPWRDFQRRSFNAITLRTSELVRSLQQETVGKERFTPSRRVALLISADPKVHNKLDEWQDDSMSELTVVPIDPLAAPDEQILDLLAINLRSRLGERDLYRTQNPVSGFDFFGRAALLRNLSASINGDENVAILGLRRSGKTSVLQELRRQLRPRGVVMPIADFQMLEDQSAEELVNSIASNLNEELKLSKASGIDLWIGDNAEQESHDMTPNSLSDRLKRVAARNSHIRVVIAIDEIESAAAIARTNPVAIKVLLGTLRSAAQGRENISLLFSGVANRMFRSSTLGDAGAVDNPMFGQVSSVHLTSFDRDETAALVRDLGEPMLLKWDDMAVDQIHNLTGGFPYFVRDLASTVRKSVRARVGGANNSDLITISSDDIAAEVSGWAARAAEAWSGIVAALGIHYPAAAALLDTSLTEAELNEWVSGDAEAVSAAEDLLALKLLISEGSTLKYSPTLAAMQSLHSLQSPGGNRAVATHSPVPDALADLIRGGESHVLEFKQTSRINVHTGMKDPEMENEVLKTVAGFLNSDGGELLVGIADDGSARGLEPDLGLFKQSYDRYERWIRGDLLAKRIDKQLVADNVRMEFLPFRGKTILRIGVTPSREPAWVDDKSLFRRLGNQTIAVEGGREIQAFLAQRNGADHRSSATSPR
jgi:hypothetical protein